MTRIKGDIGVALFAATAAVLDVMLRMAVGVYGEVEDEVAIRIAGGIGDALGDVYVRANAGDFEWLEE